MTIRAIDAHGHGVFGQVRIRGPHRHGQAGRGPDQAEPRGLSGPAESADLGIRFRVIESEGLRPAILFGASADGI